MARPVRERSVPRSLRAAGGVALALFLLTSAAAVAAPTADGLDRSGSGPCALLPALYPVLVNGSSNSSFITLYPIVVPMNSSSAPSVPPPSFNGTLGVPWPTNLSTANPPKATVGEARADWATICGGPEFVYLSGQVSAFDFQTGTTADTLTGNVSLVVGFGWSATCPGGNRFNATNSSSAGSVNWSHPNFTGSGCSYQVDWFGNFYPNGTTNVSGPFEHVQPAFYGSPAPPPGFPGGPPGGGLGPTAFLAAGLVLLVPVALAIALALAITRRADRARGASAPAPSPSWSGPPAPARPAPPGRTPEEAAAAEPDPLSDLL